MVRFLVTLLVGVVLLVGGIACSAKTTQSTERQETTTPGRIPAQPKP
jgi:hypothetical protein